MTNLLMRPINKIRRALIKARRLLMDYRSPFATPAERSKLAAQETLVKGLQDQLVAERVEEEWEIDQNEHRRKTHR